MRGLFTEVGGRKVECAVKMLKTDEVPNRKVSSDSNSNYVLLQ